MSGFEPATPESDHAAPLPAAPAPKPEGDVLVDPRTLPSFQTVEEAVSRARTEAEQVPIEVEDESMASAIADALQSIKHVRQDTEAARKQEKRPYEVTGKRIEASFKELLSPLGAIEESLKERLVKFETRRRAAAEAERKREERNAAERQKREDEKAAKEGRASKHHAPPPPKKVASGARGQSGAKSSVKEVTKYEITDVDKLPTGYWERKPLRGQIKAAVEQGLVIEGVRVWKEPVVATR